MSRDFNTFEIVLQIAHSVRYDIESHKYKNNTDAILNNIKNHMENKRGTSTKIYYAKIWAI